MKRLRVYYAVSPTTSELVVVVTDNETDVKIRYFAPEQYQPVGLGPSAPDFAIAKAKEWFPTATSCAIWDDEERAWMDHDYTSRMKVTFVRDGTDELAPYTITMTGGEIVLDDGAMDTKYGREQESDNERLASGEVVEVVGFLVDAIDFDYEDHDGPYDVFFYEASDLVGQTIPIARRSDGTWHYYGGEYVVHPLVVERGA